MRRAVAAAAMGLAALLAGCAEKVLPVDRAGDTTALPGGSARAVVATAPAQAAAPAPPAAGPAPDQCGARPLAYLVGKPRTEIPVPVDPSRRRVVCTTCPRTDDHVPDRQTITYDPATNLVTGVTCG